MGSPTNSIDFTQRELAVLYLIIEGLTAKEIAKKLNITEATVVGHKTNLMHKIGAKNTADLIYKSFRDGFL